MEAAGHPRPWLLLHQTPFPPVPRFRLVSFLATCILLLPSCETLSKLYVPGRSRHPEVQRPLASCVGQQRCRAGNQLVGSALPFVASFLHLSILWGRKFSSICALSCPDV